MTRQEALSSIRDRDSIENIQELTNRFIAEVDPLKVILFGSFADGTYTVDSDYDFYLVIDDNRNVSEATDQA